MIDNCEHVLAAAADLIEAILTQSATVRVVATSREGLGVPDEQVWPVRSLDAAAGIDSAAVSLFVERAQGIAPSFSMVDGDEAAAVTEICQRLDGIPLAIELAASRMASMTASEMRDRLDHRFRLLVGSRRGLERHHTLRHAMAWSYDLLDDTEKTVLDRCSVFAGGFDLQSACAVAGSDDLDEYAILEVLDALVRKSLLIADRSSGRTRFSMLETIRQFAEDQLVAGGEASEIRAAHSRYFAGREADIMALWDSPRQREAYGWFTIELANLRAAFRWAADHGDLDVAATIASYAGWLGVLVQTLEPIAWAEELIEPARAVDHPRLAFLYVTASLCYATGRIEEAVRYSDAAQIVVGNSHEAPPYGIEACAWICIPSHRAARADGRGVPRPARTPPRHPRPHPGMAGCRPCSGPFRWGGDGLRGWPHRGCGDNRQPLCCSRGRSGPTVSLSVTRIPSRRLMPCGRGLVIAQDSGNRTIASVLANGLARLEAEHGDTVSAFDHLTLAIRGFHNAGDTTTLRVPLAILAALFGRLGRYEPAATIAGFALSPFSASAVPEITTAITHLREVLGEATYESLARKGETMTTAAMATYAYDQIDQARTELEHSRLSRASRVSNARAARAAQHLLNRPCQGHHFLLPCVHLGYTHAGHRNLDARSSCGV